MYKLLLLMFVAAASLPADSGVLNGRVSDPSGAIVPSATIRILNSATGETTVLTSDREGKFRAGSLSAASYEILAESPGFALYRTQGIQLRENATTLLEVRLQIAALGEEVTVTSKAPAGEDAVETSSGNAREILEIREVRESAAKDVGEALADLDGVWKVRKAGIANDVVVRGFQQDNVKVIIDGAMIHGACPGNMDPAASHVDFAEIDTIEVTKGPFDVRNQGSLGGTVNVVSKRPGYGFQLTPSLVAGSFAFANPSLVGSYAGSKFFGLAGYSYRRSDPYKDGKGGSVTGYANYKPSGAAHKAFDVDTAWGRLGVQLSPRQSLEIAYTRQRAGLTLYPALTMDALYDNADRLSANWNMGELTGFVKGLRAEGYYSRVAHWMTDELRTTGVASLGFNMGTFAGTKAVGGRLEANLGDVAVGIDGYVRGWSVVANMVSAGKYSAQASLPDVRMLVSGAYLAYSRSFGNLALAAGGRLDAANSAVRSRSLDSNLYWIYHSTRSTSATDIAPSASARVTYALPRGIQLFAGIGSNVRLPDPQERYYAVRRMGTDWVGNPTLDPTRNTEIDLGVNLRYSRVTLRPTVFYGRLSNFVAIALGRKLNPMPGYMNPSARTFQAVDARMYGGEVAYSVGFTQSVLLSGGASYTRGIEFANTAAGLPKGNMAEIPGLKTRASLRYGNRLFFAEVDGLAVARQDRVNRLLQEQPTPGYGLLGFKAGIHRGRVNISVGLDNALNRFYYEHLSFQRDPFRSGVRIPEPGRSVYLNVSVRARGE